MHAEMKISSNLQEEHTRGLLRVWQDLVLLCVDNSGAPHQRGNEGSNYGSIYPCDRDVCGESCLLNSLTLHGQPEVIHMYLI